MQIYFNDFHKNKYINKTPKEDINFGSKVYENTAKKVADLILSYRRPFKGEINSAADLSYLKDLTANIVQTFIKKDIQIPAAIVGFPMKSPSRLKTISPSADRAEFEALKHLNKLTQDIAKIYDNGISLKIYSDGRVFVNTIKGSNDFDVSEYIKKVREFLKILETKNLEIVTIDDIYDTSAQKAREKLFKDFPVDKEEISAALEKDPALHQYKIFMRDFYAKDIRAQNPQMSKRQSKIEGEKVALGVICGSKSLDKCINSIHKEGLLRLSVHPKPTHDLCNKIGIFLNSSKIDCPAPWHGAALKISSDKFIYQKKTLLETAGCKLVSDMDGKGAYYDLPANINPKLNLKA